MFLLNYILLKNTDLLLGTLEELWLYTHNLMKLISKPQMYLNIRKYKKGYHTLCYSTTIICVVLRC